MANTKKYWFNGYDNPALTICNLDDYPNEDLSAMGLVELTDAQYKAHCAVEDSYNASIEWLEDKQEEYAKGLNK